MKIIRCTRKLLKELKVEPEENVWEKSWLESWHADVFILERRKCILITNDRTLYSFFLPAFHKDNFLHFRHIVNEYFFKSMMHEGFSQNIIEKVLSVGDDMVFTKSANTAVMGSMTNFKQCIEVVILMHGGLEHCSSFEIQRSINTMPMKAINYQLPVELFVDKLEND